MKTVIISDLHLQASRPELTALAFSLLDNIAKHCDELYILGDLFEYWLGDDACDTTATEVAHRLNGLKQQNVAISIMHGNRDFLLGNQYVNSFGGQLLNADTITLDIANKKTLLMHGDTLCTDDSQYQFYRRMVRNSGWQNDFLAKSISEREATARMIRSTSKAHGHRAHTEKIADINLDTFEEAVTCNGVERVIHGHTHRPGSHQHAVSGATVERLVLGDWHTDYAVIAVCDNDTCELMIWNGNSLSPFS
ncbi:UDP-2,3-diacylglucosamine diphosphatase [Chromatiales bacterium (ex Bugula neritina AB1)]|nr:UDP-2,3-diacylglucosamine diphosphatase [Chromatiales bacterium (ex Bugula neritina AB1)]